MLIQELMLGELHGYRQYQDMPLIDAIRKIGANNETQMRNGAFGAVLIPDSKSFVYKIWAKDSGYELYYDMIKKHQGNPFFPKVIGEKRTIQGTTGKSGLKINVIKLEKLTPVEKSSPIMAAFSYAMNLDNLSVESIKSLLGGDKKALGRAKGEVGKAIDNHARNQYKTHDWDEKNTRNAQFNAEYREGKMNGRRAILALRKLEKYDLVSMVQSMKLLKELQDEHGLDADMHNGNFMMRGDQIVVTDPFCDFGNSIRIDSQNVLVKRSTSEKELKNQLANAIAKRKDALAADNEEEIDKWHDEIKRLRGLLD